MLRISLKFLVILAVTSCTSLLAQTASHTPAGGGFLFVTFKGQQDLVVGQFMSGEGFTFPFHFRHGCVMLLTSAEYQRQEAAYPSTASVK